MDSGLFPRGVCTARHLLQGPPLPFTEFADRVRARFDFEHPGVRRGAPAYFESLAIAAYRTYLWTVTGVRQANALHEKFGPRKRPY